MRDIKMQRKLKKEGREKPWLNHEGYRDPTAYQALRNIEKETARTAGPVPSRQKRKTPDRMADVKPMQGTTISRREKP